MRAQNFTLLLDEVEGERTLTRNGQPDEWALLLPDTGLTGRRDAATAARSRSAARSLTFIPAGDSEIHLSGSGRAVRLFTVASEDLAEQAHNAAAYAERHANLPPFAPWPEAPAEQVRSYDLDVAPEQGRFGRIFRCSTLMVNFLEPNDGPRDPTKLSPHAHADFEQCSLALEGEYVHHLRWPWTPDRTVWREDEHVRVGPPSVTIISAQVEHTSEPVGAGLNQFVDIFCPPRADFSDMPGWVLNAEDYPLRPAQH